MRCRIAAAQQDMAAAERTAGADHDRKAMTLWEEISQTKPVAAEFVRDRNPPLLRRNPQVVQAFSIWRAERLPRGNADESWAARTSVESRRTYSPSPA